MIQHEQDAQPSSDVMLVVAALILSVMSALRAGDAIGRVQRAFAVGQVTKQEDRGVTILAGNDDIPTPGLGLTHQLGITFCLTCCTPKPGLDSVFRVQELSR